MERGGSWGHPASGLDGKGTLGNAGHLSHFGVERGKLDVTYAEMVA
jgi:hypothetical protein